MISATSSYKLTRSIDDHLLRLYIDTYHPIFLWLLYDMLLIKFEDVTQEQCSVI